jgi:hypothetical protein
MDEDLHLRSIRKGMELRPEQVEISKVAPLFVPMTFFAAGNWPGPYTRLRAREIGLTWSVLLPDDTMRYVDHEMVRYWNTQGVDWRQVALRNLADHSGNNPWTHEYRRTTGEIYAIAMMHSDGIGPSRLLLRDRLSSLFRDGYCVALPERSCALAFSVDLEGPELSKLQGVIRDCHQKGTRPLAPRIYVSDDLLPETGRE